MDYENGDSKESRKYSKERKYYDDDYNNDGDKYYKIKQKYKERDDFKYKDKREYYRDKECYYSHKEKDKEWKDYRDKERDRKEKEKLYKYKDRSERENKRRRSKNRSVSPFTKKHSRSRSRSRSKSRHRSRSKSRSRSPSRRSSHSRHVSSSSKHKSSSSSYYEDKRYESSSYSRSNKDLPEPPPSYSQIKGQRKMMILEKLGIDLVVPGTLDKQQSGTTQTAAGTGQKGVTVTGELAAYCNITPANSRMIMERLNRKKLLWTNKTNEQKTNVESKDGANAAGGKPNTMWQSAIFSKDGDNKQTEKFKRLMGIKDDSSDESKSNAATVSSDGKDIIKRQEEMFQNMEMQYEVARASTHTHRGIGLGFGIHQYPR